MPDNTSNEPTEESNIPKDFFLDVEDDQKQVKDNIVQRVSESTETSDEEVIAEKVDQHYDELLEDAVVTDHIPTLTENLVKQELRDESKPEDK